MVPETQTGTEPSSSPTILYQEQAATQPETSAVPETQSIEVTQTTSEMEVSREPSEICEEGGGVCVDSSASLEATPSGIVAVVTEGDDLVRPNVEPEQPVEAGGQEGMVEREGDRKEEVEAVSAEQVPREAESEELVEQEVVTREQATLGQADTTQGEMGAGVIGEGGMGESGSAEVPMQEVVAAEGEVVGVVRGEEEESEEMEERGEEEEEKKRQWRSVRRRKKRSVLLYPHVDIFVHHSVVNHYQ